MANKPLQGVLQQIRRITAVQTSRALSDRELLQRFAGSNDEAAFTVLVERYGGLVLGFCRRALGSFHDAEDACQATFLVLARKAASIRKTASLGSWLHRVAGSVAANMRRERARRVRREHEAQPALAQEPASDLHSRELQGVLDEELQRLPERYRSPLILCYLNGQTRDEAAGRLGLTPAALHRRLERGRRLLGDRLTRRGLTLSAALTAAAAGEGVSQAALSPSIVLFLTKAATLLASGQTPAGSVVSAQVLSIARQALRAMMLTKLKIGMATLLCAGLTLATVGGMLGRAGFIHEGEPEARALIASAASPEPVIDATTDDAKKLQGEWRAVQAEMNGKKDRSAGVKNLRMVIKGNEMTIGGASGEGPGRKKRFKLETSSSPKGIDITSLDGQEEGQTVAGIYSVEGDRLQICIPDRAKDLSKRPTDFRTRDGDGLMLLVLERVKPKVPGAGQRKPTAEEEAKELEGEWRTVEYERDGVKAPSYQIRSSFEIWTFNGDAVSTKRVEGSDMEPGAKFRLDPTRSPKVIDITWVDGRLKDQVVAGIYSLDDAKLWLCTAPPSKDSTKRPTEFKTRKGDGLTLLVLQRVIPSRQDSETGPRQTPVHKAADEFGTFMREWRQADRDFQDAYWKAKTPDERQKVRAEKEPKPGPFAERCLKLGEKYPDTAAGLAALCWAVSNALKTEAGPKALAILKDGAMARADPEELMQALDSGRNLHGGNPEQLAPLVLARAKQVLDHPRAPRLLAWVCTCYMHAESAEPPPIFAEAADLIVKRFADSPDINWLCECLGGNGGGCPPWALKYEKQLRTILKANHHLRVRSTAQIALASVLQQSGQDEEAQKLYEQFFKEYEKGAPNDPWEGILKQLLSHAKHELEEIRERGIGKPAQEIEGEDLDGKPMRLSDYKGKVVLLDFWGFW